jgi:protein-S-isoprenylcysteine O-methyltransferase Ste14
MPNLSWWRNERGEVYVVVQLVLFALVVTGPLQVSWPLVPMVLREPALWTGGLFIVLGVTLAVVSVIVLGRNLSPLPHPKADATLVESGPYHLVRHPIYTGLILAAVGWALFTNTLLTFAYALALVALFDVKSRREERALRKQFPEYASYQEHTKRLIPFIY